MDILSGATVSTLYLVLLILGLIYALFLLFSGQFGGGDADLGHGDLDLGHGGMDHGDLHVPGGDHAAGGEDRTGLSPISPFTIAIFVTAFGATGLVARGLFQASERPSLIWATLGGLIVSTLAYIGFTYLFIKPQGSSEVRVADLVGIEAEVITPIPAGGLGEIALVAQGGRVTYSARTKDGAGLPAGQVVRILRILGGVAYVESIKEI
ncbi:MAG TPA: NfeD family protein [Anaerolineales bacterium]|nr:NfeD family protein [Anaerolineales bacterium]